MKSRHRIFWGGFGNNYTKQKEIKIELDLKQFIKEIDLSIQNKVMSPGTEAVLLSKKVASLFKIVVE